MPVAGWRRTRYPVPCVSPDAGSMRMTLGDVLRFGETTITFRWQGQPEVPETLYA